MKTFLRSATFILFLVTLSACTRTEAPAPVITFGEGEGAGSAGVHKVEKGDTLYSISQRYQLAIRDIAIKNNLYPPFDLTVGERLNLPPPRQYRVREGDTIYRISRLFGVNSSEISRLNELSAPYSITPGQSLRLPSQSWKAETPREIAQDASSSFSVTEAPPLEGAPPASVETAQLDEPARSAPKSRVTTRPPARSSGNFMKPVDGRVVSGFGPKKDGLHNDGINIAAPRGAPVRAAENGVVVYAGDELKASGNLVLIRHQGHYMTAYAHLDKTMIKRGMTVKRGQTIGTVGSSGSVSSPQLHFEVRKGTKAINPAKYLG